MDHDLARIRAIFDEAIEVPKERRPALLAERCAGDEALRRRMEALIATAEGDDRFLSEPTRDKPAGDASTLGTMPLSERPGTRIGPYKLLQVIGEGGFGVVFMAEQERPVRRRVALKIIKLGMDTKQVIARFEAERQALALMDHPNIARVFDGGATDAGRPYFVMELVKGEPITTYCDRQNLTIPERLEVFTQICRAVQHAHTKGVIHRDIKPNNVLVATQDGRPHAKVIDFGIAKATDHRLTEKTLFTEHRALIGTPEYMSPEQAEGSLDIDTRTDVYSLGVLLYELLTGSTPFDAKQLRSAAYGEVQRIIREVEPPTPSVRIEQSIQALPEVAAHRRAEPSRLGGQVRGELDWIVMKSLEKDRSRRYETANVLAADVQRHLAGEPVDAAPPGVGYRVRKFVRKHKRAVVAVSCVAASLVLGIAGTTWMWTDLNRQVSAARDTLASVVARHTPPITVGGVEVEIKDEAGQTLGFVRIDDKDRDAKGNPKVELFGPGAPHDPTRPTLEGIAAVRMLGQYASDSAREAESRTNELEAKNSQLLEEVKRARVAEATSKTARWKARVLSLAYNEDIGDSPENWQEPLLQLRDALATLEELLGPSHIDTVKALWALGGAHGFSGGSRESKAMFEEAGKRLEQAGKHPDSELVLEYAKLLMGYFAAVDPNSAERWARRTGLAIPSIVESEGEASLSELMNFYWFTVKTEIACRAVGTCSEHSTAEELGRVLAASTQGQWLLSITLFYYGTGIDVNFEKIARIAGEYLAQSPDDPLVLTALSLAQLRLNKPAEALETAGRAAAARVAAGLLESPLDVGNIAMAHFKLGHKDQASQGLARLRELAVQQGFQEAWGLGPFLSKAEEMIDPHPTTEQQLTEETKQRRLAEATVVLQRTAAGVSWEELASSTAETRRALDTRIELLGIDHPGVAEAAIILWNEYGARDPRDLELFAQIASGLKESERAWADQDYRLAMATASIATLCEDFDSAAWWYRLLGLRLLDHIPVSLNGRWPGVAYELYKSVSNGSPLGWADDRFGHALAKIDADTVRRFATCVDSNLTFRSFPPSQEALLVEHYRAGRYAEALAAAESAADLYRQNQMAPWPRCLAIRAMAQFKLGDSDKAREFLAQLRERMVGFNEPEYQALLAEAEALIEPAVEVPSLP